MAGTDDYLFSPWKGLSCDPNLWKGQLRGRGGATGSKSEWSAGNFHRESAEQQMLSKMDTNMLSSRCDRSIMGEQPSKMNSISTVSQYKCHRLRRT